MASRHPFDRLRLFDRLRELNLLPSKLPLHICKT
jgi:hypothetical protein